MTVPSTEAAGLETPVVEANTPDANAAESSTADQGVKSSLDAVNAALGKLEKSPASVEQDPKEPDPNSPPKDDDISDEEKKYSQAAQRRIRELVGARKTIEAEAEPLRKQVEELKPKVEAHEALTGYMRQHSISGEQLENTMAITAMINAGDHTRALPILRSLLAQMENQAGEVLPPDLHRQVELGYLTESHAKQLHKSTLAARRAEENATKAQRDAETTRHQAEVGERVRTAVTAADAWSAEQQTKDPDWNQKRDLVTEAMELALHKAGPEGYPRTDQDVRKLLDKVKADVEAKVSRFRPPPKPIDPPVTGKGASPRSVAKPASVLDAVEQGLARSHSG